jgi:dTDP-4-amino-4,6-dideoxygalactose transaminase
VPPDLPAIRSLIGDRPLLYDNAHGFGTEIHGERYGAEADIEVFSLHATKVLPSLEGGLVRCKSTAMRELVSALRNHGKTADPLNSHLGFNAKMNEWSAALALSSLAAVDATLERRRTYLFRLREALANAGFTVQALPDGVTPSGQDLVVRCSGNRQHVQQHFLAHGIETRPYFGVNLHQLSRFSSHPVLAITEALNASVLAFPLHSRMTEKELSRLEVAAAALQP